jgi:hypothetical protein
MNTSPWEHPIHCIETSRRRALVTENSNLRKNGKTPPFLTDTCGTQNHHHHALLINLQIEEADEYRRKLGKQKNKAGSCIKYISGAEVARRLRTFQKTG